MAQTWILRSDMSPLQAIDTGADASICGQCPHRPALYRAAGVARCYVDVSRAPLAVWRAYKRGRYQADGSALRHCSAVRIGAYGDPAAVPTVVWERLVSGTGAQTVTGYTHQWRTCDQGLRDLVMASADNWRDWFEAKALGWRTFRVLRPGQARTATEISCPASAEAGNRKQCITCGICDGLRRVGVAGADVAIVQH